MIFRLTEMLCRNSSTLLTASQFLRFFFSSTVSSLIAQVSGHSIASDVVEIVVVGGSSVVAKGGHWFGSVTLNLWISGPVLTTVLTQRFDRKSTQFKLLTRSPSPTISIGAEINLANPSSVLEQISIDRHEFIGTEMDDHKIERRECAWIDRCNISTRPLKHFKVWKKALEA